MFKDTPYLTFELLLGIVVLVGTCGARVQYTERAVLVSVLVL